MKKRGLAHNELKSAEPAIADLSKASEKGSKTIEVYSTLGSLYFREQNLIKAVESYDKAINLGAKDAVIYNNRGKAKFLQDKISEAIADYDLALAEKPDYDQALLNRGTAYYKQGNYSASIADLEKTEKKSPEVAEMLGLAYYKTQQFDKALQNMKSAVSGGIKNAELYYFKGNILFDKEEYRQAVSDFQKQKREE